MDQEDKRSALRKVVSAVMERIKAIVPEVVETLTDKVIPQGAAEIAQALNTGSAYVPYGAAQSPLEPEANRSSQQSLEQLLDEYASRGPQQQQEVARGIDR